MAKKYMGFEGEMYYGAAGATAATKITNSQDINYELDFDEGDTTERGDGTLPPIETVEVTVRKISGLTLQMLNKEADATLAALLSAAATATPVAIRTKDKAAGKGVDADFFVKWKHGMPLKGQQTLEFTFRPTDRLRAVQLYV
jgi:hypothetical protein